MCSSDLVRLRVIEIGIAISVAPTTAPSFQISRATATLGTASTTLAGQMFDSADGSSGAGVGIFESAWSVAPTINTTYHRMFGLPVTAGGGTTKEFAALLAEPTAFVIGGADGLDPAIRRGASLLLRLSALTMPHALAQVVLCEQIYRAATLLTGHPYHRE